MENLTKLNRRRWVVQLALTTGLALLFLAPLLWGLQGVPSARADPGTLYVDGASGQDIPTCGTTIAPCQTISYTLNSRASDGDTIFIATGTYTENLTITGITVSLRGGYNISGTLWLTSTGETVIDGGHADRVFLIHDSNSVLENLTLTGGQAPSAQCWGGGVWVTNGDVTIRSSTITGNAGDCGGAGIEVNHDWGPSHLTLESSTVSYNTGGERGGLQVWGANASAEVRDVTFVSNTAGDSGGGIAVVNGSSAIISNSRIISNTAGNAGGGVAVRGDASVTITGTQIYANTAVWDEGGGLSSNSGSVSLLSSWVVANAALDNDGGGIAVGQNGSAYVENSIIAGNIGANGGGLWLIHTGGLFRIVNSHIVGNHAADEGGGIASAHSAQVEVTNTLIISNAGNTGIADRDGSGSVFLLYYCDTYGNSPDGMDGMTITRANCLGLPPEDGLNPRMSGGPLPGGVGPDFADQWMKYDYHLQAGSPAIDAGTNIGAPTTDFEGNQRPLDGDLDGIATTDMGADEFRPYRIYLPLTLKNFGP